MNIVNRLVAIVIFLLILALAIGAIAIATTLLAVSAVDQVYAYPPLHHALTDVTALPRNIRTLITVVSVAVAILMLLLLRLELLIHRQERTLVLSEQQGGEVTIGLDTLRKVAEQASRDIPGIDGASCHVRAPQGILRVRCHATAIPFANAAAIGDQVETAVRERLEQTLGKPVEHVKVNVDLKQSGSAVQLR